jgi:hypothetical protein
MSTFLLFLKEKYTHDETGAGADDEHRSRGAGAALLFESVALMAFEEDVRGIRRKGRGRTRHGLGFCDAWGSERRGC